jgi:hypothetical protein
MFKYIKKGDIMDISSSTAAAPSSTQIEAMEKALESDEQQVLKVLESANEQSQKVTAQKTGLGNNLNIAG